MSKENIMETKNEKHTLTDKQNSLHKFKWFWPWQDQQEETWLQDWARAGLHLRSSDGFGFYTFEKSEPAETVYRLDYNYLQKSEREQYLQLFEDAGWDYVGEMNSWHYFRKSLAANQRAEIFTDNESKVQKYKRFLSDMMFLVPIYVLPFILTLDYDPGHLWILILARILSLGLLLTAVLIEVKVFLRIRQLKQL